MAWAKFGGPTVSPLAMLRKEIVILSDQWTTNKTTKTQKTKTKHKTQKNKKNKMRCAPFNLSPIYSPGILPGSNNLTF